MARYEARKDHQAPQKHSSINRQQNSILHKNEQTFFLIFTKISQKLQDCHFVSFFIKTPDFRMFLVYFSLPLHHPILHRKTHSTLSSPVLCYVMLKLRYTIISFVWIIMEKGCKLISERK